MRSYLRGLGSLKKQKFCFRATHKEKAAPVHFHRQGYELPQASPIVLILEPEPQRPRKPLNHRRREMAGNPVTELRGCPPRVERFMRKYLEGCPIRLCTGQYREKANPTGPRGSEGDRHPPLHTQTGAHGEPIWQVENVKRRGGRKERRGE